MKEPNITNYNSYNEYYDAMIIYIVWKWKDAENKLNFI